MKESKRIAIISASILTTSALVPIIGISIPFTKRDVLTKKIVHETVDLFKNDISKIYRKSFYTRQIAEWIKDYVKKLGFEVYEDEYRAPSFESFSSGNLFYDIPCTKGFEKYPGVTLQAHMDMICEVSEDRKEPYDWSKGVEIVQEGNILHSKDYQTTIGADNGIGLALLLILTKYHNEFDHGPIRILFTADEEDGDSGASLLNAEKLQYDNIINVDNEQLGMITKSCAGTYNTHYNIALNWTTPTASYKQYEVTVSKFVGGHSAVEIVNNTGCAIKGANLVLSDMSKVANVELTSFSSENSNSAISSIATFTVSTDLNNFGQWIDNEIVALRKAFPRDKDCTISYKEVNNKNEAKYCLDVNETKSFISVVDKLSFGVLEWLDEETKQVKTSCNIGPLIILNNENWSMQMMSRSIFEQEEINLSIKNTNYIKDKFTLVNDPRIVLTPSWEYKEKVPLVDLLSKAYKDNKITSSIDNSHGWLECSFFSKFRENADIAALGVTITNSHKCIESVDISTIKPVLNTLLYTLANINNK